MNRQERAEESKRYIALTSLNDFGMTDGEYHALRLDAMRLHRWAEAECNGDIQRDETTGKCFRHYGHNGPGPFFTVKTADRETPARKRIEALCKRYNLALEMQGDPRGAAVKVTLQDGRTFYFGYGA